MSERRHIRESDTLQDPFGRLIALPELNMSVAPRAAETLWQRPCGDE